MFPPDYVAYFIEKSQEPDFDFSSMRKEMEKNGIPEQDIKTIIRVVDDNIRSRGVTKNSMTGQGMGYILLGIGITIIGTVITFGTFFGIIDTGNSFIIAYGPLLIGPSLLFFGISRHHKEQSREVIKKRWNNTKEY